MPSPAETGTPIRVAATQKPPCHEVQLAELLGTVKVGVFELGLAASGSGAKVDVAWSHSFLPEGEAQGRSQRPGQQNPACGSRASSAKAASQPSRSSSQGAVMPEATARLCSFTLLPRPALDGLPWNQQEQRLEQGLGSRCPLRERAMPPSQAGPIAAGGSEWKRLEPALYSIFAQSRQKLR